MMKIKIHKCLWRATTNEPVRMSRMKVINSGAAYSPALAQFVKKAIEAILNRHYVDSTIRETTEVL